MSTAVWDALGIAETNDIGTVRSAYARALKQIDMDADPRAYIALREARDHAIFLIRRSAIEAAQGRRDKSETPHQASPGLEPTEDPITVPAASYEDHVAQLTRLLFPDGDDVDPGTRHDELLKAHFNALLTDPRMDEIAFRVQAEAQLAHLIAGSLPRSRSLIELAIPAFNWLGPARVDTLPAVAAILDHAQSLGDRQATDIDDSQSPIFSSGATGHTTGVHTSDTIDHNAEFYSAHYNDLVALFFPQDENAQPLTPEQKVAARGHFATLVSDPRMDLVGFRIGAESQFAQLIAYSTPRSDCIVLMAIDFFDWTTTEERIDQPELIAHILDRARGIRFVDAVQAPDHPFHAAWTELTTPLGDKLRPAVSVQPATMYRLLASIRAEQPLIERDLDPARVAMWDKKLAKYGSSMGPPRQSGGRVPLWAIAIGVFILLSLLGRLGESMGNTSGFTSPPATLVGSRSGLSATMADSAVDIDPVLAEIGGNGLTLGVLRDKNTALSTLLDSKWTLARDQGQNLSDFQRETGKLLLDRIATTVRNSADDNLIIHYQQERLSDLRMLALSAPADCVYLGRPGRIAVGDVPAFFSPERKELYARILERADVKSQPIESTGPQLDRAELSAIAARAGSSPSQVTMLLDGKMGSNEQQCAARIAEIEALLALPVTRGAKLLKLI
ncbi:hypothetical protein [Sphingomonas pruni]|uniref:hypothetical protein n=1 Tax=Sphingomonas pruni TaxID=40683 RepID=UPI000836208A|nr:hypothetical protein [Sphingomonas pruni]